MGKSEFQREQSIGYSGKLVNWKLVRNATIVQEVFKTTTGSNREAMGIIFQHFHSTNIFQPNDTHFPVQSILPRIAFSEYQQINMKSTEFQIMIVFRWAEYYKTFTEVVTQLG